MFKEAREIYDSNGFLLQYKKRLQLSWMSIAPSYYTIIMLKMDIQEHSIGPVRFCS